MTSRLLLLSAVALLALGGCAEAERLARDTMGAATGVSGTVDANWTMTPQTYRGRVGERFAYRCPSGGRPSSIWGSGPYSDDSSVCTAGVHAGVISMARGGVVVIEITPGQERYEGSSRNGVQTSNWGSWPGSFRVVR